MRPQKYDPSKGFQGNIEDALWENQYRCNEIYQESVVRASDDVSNRETAEQNHTDSYLDLVECQQTVSDHELRILELELKINQLLGENK